MYGNKKNLEQNSNGQKSGKNNKQLGKNNSVNLGNEAGDIFQLSFSNEENIKNLSFQNNQKGSNFPGNNIIDENNINNDNDIEEEINPNPNQVNIAEFADDLKKLKDDNGFQQKVLDIAEISKDSALKAGNDKKNEIDYSVIDKNLPEPKSKRGDKPLLYEDPAELIENEIRNDGDQNEEERDDLSAGQESFDNLDIVPWGSFLPRKRKRRNRQEAENQQEGKNLWEDIDLSDDEDQSEIENRQEVENQREAGNRQEVENRPEAGNRGSGVKRFFTNIFKWIGIQLSRLFSSNSRRLYNNVTSNALDNTAIQTNRTQDLIPGWNGAKFEKGPNGEDNILADFRRVPTVWSQLTAARAEDSKGKPLPPKISLYVRQNQEAADNPNNDPGTDQGHSSIGIEYSRWSVRTGKYERYDLRYGFFPADDSKLAGAHDISSKAIIPGRLKNEAGKTYSIRRTFPATAQQVNKILSASQTYADGGYNSITRNCTTFVREMIQKEAGITAGDQIFRNNEPGLANQPNAAGNEEPNPALWERIAMEKNLEDLSLENDLSYGGFGNKSFTKQDYRNYKESLVNNGNINEGDLPNAAAENMRNLKGNDAGEIGSRQYYGSADPDANNEKPELYVDNLQQAIDREASELIRNILSVYNKDSVGELDLDKNQKKILAQIKQYGKTLSDVKPSIDEAAHGYKIEKLQNARNQMDKHIKDLGMLFNTFQNNRLLQSSVLHMISLLEFGNEYIDREYSMQSKTDYSSGEVGYMRSVFKRKGKYQIAYKKTLENGKTKTISIGSMSPSHYESYLQIYHNPDDAIKNYTDFIILSEKRDRTPAEEKKYKKLSQMDKLASEFDNSHNYMIEKESYNQQDVDYAFSLGNKDEPFNKEVSQGNKLSVTSSFNFTPSGIYKSLIFEKIFGGVFDRLKNLKHYKDILENYKYFIGWLDYDMKTCLEKKSEEMKTVIRAQRKSLSEKLEDDAKPNGVYKDLMKTIENDWIKRLDDNGKESQDVEEAIEEAFHDIRLGRGNTPHEFRDKLFSLIEEVYYDEEQNPDDEPIIE